MLLNWLLMSVTTYNIFFVLPGRCFGIKPTLKDNCTCETSQGTYSLFPLQRKDGKPRFEINLKGYTYTYNPCKPYTLSSKKGTCKNVALCKYDTDGSPHVYIDIGEQRDVQCEMEDGNMVLIYPINNPDVPTHESKVILVCNKDSRADPEFHLVNENAMIFNLTSHCGCLNGCQPGPVTTIQPLPTTPGSFPGPITPSGPETPSPRPKDSYSNWELVILLPSLAAFVVMVICFACLWWRLSDIKVALLYRCCLCYEYTDPRRQERIVSATETSSLINNIADYRAVEHEDAVTKDKIKEPVQVEEEDVDKDYQFAGKGDKTVVV